MTENNNSPAGWYADPEKQAPFRWWDGQQWTEQTSAEQIPYDQTGYQSYSGMGQPSNISNISNKRVTAGVLGIVLGSIGVHKFYLGYTKEGLLQILLTVVTCGLAGVIGLAEGIIYLTKTDQEFDQEYVYNKKAWF